MPYVGEWAAATTAAARRAVAARAEVDHPQLLAAFFESRLRVFMRHVVTLCFPSFARQTGGTAWSGSRRARPTSMPCYGAAVRPRRPDIVTSIQQPSLKLRFRGYLIISIATAAVWARPRPSPSHRTVEFRGDSETAKLANHCVADIKQERIRPVLSGRSHASTSETVVGKAVKRDLGAKNVDPYRFPGHILPPPLARAAFATHPQTWTMSFSRPTLPIVLSQRLGQRAVPTLELWHRRKALNMRQSHDIFPGNTTRPPPSRHVSPLPKEPVVPVDSGGPVGDEFPPSSGIAHYGL
jgi:hypothetical protein